MSFHRHKACLKYVMKLIRVNEGSHALDVCCGTGDWSLALAAAAGSSGEVIGLDFSENMLSVAKEKKRQLHLEQLRFIHGNAMELPFEDNSLDRKSVV